MSSKIVNRHLWGVFACMLLASLLMSGCDVKPNMGKGGTSKAGEKELIKTHNNMKALILAVHMYNNANRTLLPAYTVDANGKPLHSWRVLILPHIEQRELYSQIRLDEPWDSEHNKQFHNRDVEYFHSGATKTPKGYTDFSMVVGPDTISDGPTARTFGDITAGTSNTILFVERANPVCWMAPTEVTQEAALLGFGASPDGMAAFYNGGTTAVVGLLDGSTQQIKTEDATPEKIQAALSRASGSNSMLW